MFNVSIQRQLSEEFMSDVLTTAIEGGSNYWLKEPEAVQKALVKRQRSGPVSISFTWMDAEEPQEKTVDLAALAGAVQRVVSEGLMRDDLRDSVLHAVASGDAGSIDADGADALLQIAAFGEIVYG